MRPHRSYSVVPRLPAALEPLRELAWNARFSWDPATQDLFRMMDPNLWEACGKNPVLFLGTIPQERLDRCAQDDAVLANLERVWKDFAGYKNRESSWFAKKTGSLDSPRIAYFSAEFGLAGCLPIYSGGLGVLAGDHLKSASDLGLPLVGVGLLYQRGYFRQYVNSDGWQQESYPENDFHNLPVAPARNRDGAELVLELPLRGKTLRVKVWRCEVGRVPLLLLDTNLPDNDPSQRTITFDLYGGDSDTRLQQEFVLGVGGLRALEALGLEPDICHMNEGHSAFLAFERIRRLMQREGLSFAEARVLQAATTVFTTHTPVKAAIDLFDAGQVESVLGEWRRAFGLSPQDFMALGRERREENGAFNMAVFALRMADAANGVSRLHGRVSRRMWSHLWPGVPEDEVPISSITNGVHSQTWVSREMRELLDRYLGPRWCRDPDDGAVWEGVEKIPVEALWRTHEAQKHRLVSYVRDHLRRRLQDSNATAVEIAATGDVLDAQALTIGFARRFAPYKRATLLLRDPERLIALLSDAKRPVQIVIAGKSHPKDDAGKKLIQEIVQFSRRPEIRGRMVFVENYEMDVAINLLNGVDVWLNNPRRPLEASGTSGMKASLNGAINLSVPDGWWDEAAGRHLGWSIGAGEEYEDPETQDGIESGALYDLLEHEIVPLFFDRGKDGLPRGWIRMMKEGMKGIGPVFNTHRMVAEYAERYYRPLAARGARLLADGGRGVRELARWHARISAAWPEVRILDIEADESRERTVGDTITVRARVRLAGLGPSELDVQIWQGAVGPDGDLAHGDAVSMEPAEAWNDGTHWFRGEVTFGRTGRSGFSVRAVPRHPELATPFLPGLIRWSSDPVGEGRQQAVLA
ncbi:MAG: alpha-glucan family phosphorylase [Candidatus Eiseniibacteriota bacterium]